MGSGSGSSKNELFKRFCCIVNSDGSALIVAVLTLMVTFTLGTALLSVTASNFYMDQAEHDYQAAYYIAEGALRHQIEAMRLHMEELYASRNYDDAESFFRAFIEGLPVSTPEFKADFNRQVDASVSVSSGNRQGDTMTFTIKAEGSVGKISRSLKGSVKIRYVRQSTIFSYALFSNGTIEVNNNAEVHGNIATNTTTSGGVLLDNNSKINGDIYIGPGGNPSKVVEKKNNSVLNGQIKVSDETTQLLPIMLPSDLEDKGDLIVKNNDERYVSDGGRFNRIKINNNGKLVVYLDGDTVVRTTTMSIGNNAVIELQGPGRLLLYIDRDFDMGNNAVINNNGKPNELIVLYSGDEITVVNNAFFKGGIYAPSATVYIGNNAKVIGSIVAEKAILYNNAEMVFDSAVKDSYPMPIQDYETPGAGEELFTVISYGEE